MSQHPNAKLTPLGRAELVSRVGSAPPSPRQRARWASAARRPASGSRAPGSPGRPLRQTSSACWRPGAPCSWRRSPPRSWPGRSPSSGLGRPGRARDGRGAPPRPRHARALREGEAGRAGARRRQAGRPDHGWRRLSLARQGLRSACGAGSSCLHVAVCV